MIVWVLYMTVSLGGAQADVDLITKSKGMCEELQLHAIKTAALVGAKLQTECSGEYLEQPGDTNKRKKDI